MKNLFTLTLATFGLVALCILPKAKADAASAHSALSEFDQMSAATQLSDAKLKQQRDTAENEFRRRQATDEKAFQDQLERIGSENREILNQERTFSSKRVLELEKLAIRVLLKQFPSVVFDAHPTELVTIPESSGPSLHLPETELDLWNLREQRTGFRVGDGSKLCAITLNYGRYQFNSLTDEGMYGARGQFVHFEGSCIDSKTGQRSERISGPYLNVEGIDLASGMDYAFGEN